MTPLEMYSSLKLFLYVMIGICTLLIGSTIMDFMLYKINVIILSTHQGKVMREDDKCRFFYDRKSGNSYLKLKKKHLRDRENLGTTLPMRMFNDAIPMQHKLGFLRYSLFLLSPEPGIYNPIRLDLDNNTIYPYSSDMRNFYISTFKSRIMHYLQPKLNPALLGIGAFIVGMIFVVIIAKVANADVVDAIKGQTAQIGSFVSQLTSTAGTQASNIVPPPT